MIDLKKAHKEFVHYLNRFDCDNEKIKLKIIHTNGVVRCAREIARRMNLPEEDRELAEVIALLHDIGRFEQVRRYDSFEPCTMDHARYGVEILFGSDDPWIRSFVASDQWDAIIREAIGRHSDYSVGIIEDKQILLHAKLIRDADKLDNCRVKLVDDMKLLLGMDAGKVGAQSVTDLVFRTCMAYKSVRSENRITKMDYWVSYIAYFFDINFRETFQIIKENDFVNRIINRIPYSNPDTRDNMEQIRQTVNDYVNLAAMATPDVDQTALPGVDNIMLPGDIT
jgi:putative nucleotidyltransferase with HDIG domain